MSQAPGNNPATDYLEQLMVAFDQEAIDHVREILSGLHPADIADLIESLPLSRRELAWLNVPPPLMGEVLAEVAESVRPALVQVLDDDALVQAVSQLDTDDIADLIPALSDEVVSRLLFVLDTQERQHLDTVLSFPEDTAGGLMVLDPVTVREDITLDVVLRYLRRRGELPDYTNKLFVVDRRGKLVGEVLLSHIVTGGPEQYVREVMNTEGISFDVMTPDSEVAAAFERYNLVTAAVIDQQGMLLGRVTVDDVVDVMREVAGHIAMAPAGLREDEDIFAPVARSTGTRAIWLGVNLITAIIASWVIGLFEQTIEKAVALAVLMPIVASMGGNAGTQTVTLVVRGMALGTISESNARRVLVRELVISVFNSLIWALVVAVVALFWYQNMMLGLVIGLAMVVNLVIAALAGVLIPLGVRRVGVDPALASGVALTTVTDVVGFFVFLGLAALLLI